MASNSKTSAADVKGQIDVGQVKKKKKKVSYG